MNLNLRVIQGNPLGIMGAKFLEKVMDLLHLRHRLNDIKIENMKSRWRVLKLALWLIYPIYRIQIV